MKIMAPVSSLESAYLQIKAGADEIYVGMNENYLHNLTFTGRGKHSNQGMKILPNEEEFEDIVNFAHSKDVEVNLTANMPMMVDSIDNRLQEAFSAYVQAGMKHHIDRVIVADLGNLLYLNKIHVNVPLASSTFFTAFNVKTVEFLKELNVKRIILPHQVTISEIKEIKRSVDIELEIFVGFGCSNIDGSCHLMHNMGENIPIGIPCKSLFCVNDRKGKKYNDQILDSTLDCALCNLIELYHAGVDVVKIVGRDINPVFGASITNVYQRCLNQIKKNGKLDKEDVRNITKNIPWWKSEFCAKKRCKYDDDTLIAKSYI
jgi:putative protease